MNHQLPYFRFAQKRLSDSSNISCLTINKSSAPIGLANVLDIVRHDISHENDLQFHRLTFRSGYTLCIEANSQNVTVRGSSISSADSLCGTHTLLMDPGKSEARQI